MFLASPVKRGIHPPGTLNFNMFSGGWWPLFTGLAKNMADWKIPYAKLRSFSTSPVLYRNVPVSMCSLKMDFQIYELPVDSRIKIKSLSQVNFWAYYGSINRCNQSTFTKFWNLKFVLIPVGTLRLKWKTARPLYHRILHRSPSPLLFA
jgi:hypothetical protein